MSIGPIYEEMTSLSDYYELGIKDRKAFIQHIKKYVELFDEDDHSNDKYCCNLALFSAYCSEFDKDLALETLDTLNAIHIAHSDRHISSIVASLHNDLGLYDLACDYARMNIEKIQSANSNSCKVTEIIRAYAVLQSLIMTNAPYDPEIQEIFKKIYELTGEHYFSSNVLMGVFSRLIPLGLVPKSAVHILYSMLFFNRYLERIRPHEAITEKSNSIELLIADLLEVSKDDT